MATFAPDIPAIQAPDWTNVTKPVTQPEADKSKGLALDTAGTAVTGAASLAETTMESYLKDKVSAGVDAVRDTTTAAYESIRRAQLAGVPPDPRAVGVAGFTGSLSQGNPDVPEALQSGLDKATSLALAKSQGRGNDTLYTGALNALTKQLRAQYPGHRDFIDEQISKVSGINPANAYMSNLLTDINKASSASGKQDPITTHILSLAANERNAGNPEVQNWLLAAQHGVPNAMAGLTNAVMKSENFYWQNNRNKIIRDNNQNNKQDLSDLAQTHFDQRANQIVDETMSPTVEIPGLTDPKTMMALISDDASGKLHLTGPQRDQLVTALQGASSTMKAKLAQVYAQEGFSSQIKDPAYLKSKIDEKTQQFQAMIDAVTNDKSGTALAPHRQNQFELDTSTQQAYHSPIGQWLKDRAVLQKDLGPNWMNYADSQMLQKGNLKDIQEFYGRTTANAMADPDLRTSAGTQSLTDSINAVKAAKAQGSNVPDIAYDNLVQNVGIITKAAAGGTPQDQKVASNVVDYMFDPAKNSKLLSLFGKDFVDDKGNFHKGQFAMYDTLTQPKITDSIWNLQDKDAWGKYKVWQENSFKTLFGDKVQDLNAVQDKSEGNTPLPYSVSWDSDNHRFNLSGPAMDQLRKYDQAALPSMSMSLSPELRQAYDASRTITALNSGLSNLAYMHSKEPNSDTSEYLFKTLLDLGYEPSTKLNTGDNFAQRAINAIMASKVKPTIGQAYKAAQ